MSLESTARAREGGFTRALRICVLKTHLPNPRGSRTCENLIFQKPSQPWHEAQVMKAAGAQDDDAQKSKGHRKEAILSRIK